MPTRASFQTRARAIDHLGRGQIADCPTAVTELWKNAYDAYARNVSLHIFEGAPHIAAILDDGCGMTRHDIENRWLVVGTESKASGRDVPEADRFGLPIRPRMGEKGIGRLSAGFLAPISLLISKKLGSDYVAVLVDWRLFENPYLLISDIVLPISEFKSLSEFPSELCDMLDVIRRNVDGNIGQTSDDVNRIRNAWNQFNKQELDAGNKETTAEQILLLTDACHIPPEVLSEWDVANGLASHGTALLLIHPHRELSLWVEPENSRDDVEAKNTTDQLKMTLVGFADPDAENMRDFAYLFETHRISGRRIVLDETHQIGAEWLRSLEHHFEGTFNEAGCFQGKAQAFGQDMGEFRFSPTVPELVDSKGRSRVGPFSLRIGTFEQDPKKSSLSEEAFDAFSTAMTEFAGLMVYRDGIRVLPYGRPESDFFELEERRGRHAGREFWAHRRTFGRIGLTRIDNPDLKDKAGREGLVDNRARRLMKLLVVEVLKFTARTFYGSDSLIREKIVPELQAKYDRGKASQEKARKRRKREFLLLLPQVSRKVAEIEPEIDTIISKVEMATSARDTDQLKALCKQAHSLDTDLKSLRLPALPQGLDDKETAYRDTRDRRQSLIRRISELERKILERVSAISVRTPYEIVDESLNGRLISLRSRIKKELSSFRDLLAKLDTKWELALRSAEERFRLETGLVLSSVLNGRAMEWGLDTIAGIHDDMDQLVFNHLMSVVEAIRLLNDDIDIESALSLTDEEQQTALERLGQMSLLAQTGVVVEIIGHELEEMSSEAETNLSRLPTNCKQTPQFKRAQNGLFALVNRIRFLSPLSVVTYRSRQSITGLEIDAYLRDFFAHRFENAGVEFETSAEFQRIKLTDVPSRLLPVFINLVNNAMYWVKLASERVIRLDFTNGLVIVADSGPGVDIEDVPKLFELFFTKRPQGRGIGLYLCRVNLAVARHSIRYATADDPRILSGANFIISFQGIQTQEASGVENAGS